MVRRSRARRVDKSEATRYLAAGEALLASARALGDVADASAPYGNAIALLAIHAALSHTDALTVRYGETKSAGEHIRAAETLRSVLGTRLPNERQQALRRILGEKDSVAYQGTYYPLAEGRKLLRAAEGYCGWAAEYLNHHR